MSLMVVHLLMSTMLLVGLLKKAHENPCFRAWGEEKSQEFPSLASHAKSKASAAQQVVAVARFASWTD